MCCVTRVVPCVKVDVGLPFGCEHVDTVNNVNKACTSSVGLLGSSMAWPSSGGTEGPVAVALNWSAFIVVVSTPQLLASTA